MSGIDYLSPAESSRSVLFNNQNNNSSPKITLVLPPLRSGKLIKQGKRSKQKSESLLQDVEVKKTPRPLKLKPLKEVLTKLLGQIKKKDDYAFFISPVDPSQIPGYADVVKHPMDFGTMTVKLAKGKYRSLEEFTADFRLVTSNAKAYNPKGSIYYNEADRIEAWGMDHISKAAATVIEYETDWNIEIEQEEETPLNVDEDEDNANMSTPRDVEESLAAGSPAPSSIQLQQSRRAPRGPYKKAAGSLISESIDAEGRLPGSKDGLGAFPAGSDWADLMLALKLKGKRYRTKKERMKMEKVGPPYDADGSLNYVEMEDPFSVLSVFAPEPPSKPSLTPLYLPLPFEDNSHHEQFPQAVNVPLRRESPQVSSLDLSDQPKTKRCHWTITRHAAGRGKIKEKDDEDYTPTSKVSRDAHAADFGSFGSLVPQLAIETQVKDVSVALGSEERLFQVIHSTVESRQVKPEDDEMHASGTNFWTNQRAAEAEEYIRDIVYGGVDGSAYIRSLAEFADYHDTTLADDRPRMSLAAEIERTVLDPVTRERHSLLSEISRHLYNVALPVRPTVAAQLKSSLSLSPTAFHRLVELQNILSQQIDMAALIHNPAELFVSENEWAGARYKEERRKKIEEERAGQERLANSKNVAEYLAFAIRSHKEQEDPHIEVAYEGPDVFDYALSVSADTIAQLSQRFQNGGELSPKEVDKAHSRPEGSVAEEEEESDVPVNGQEDEDQALRALRLNLLALAKRAPLDKITSLPAELVPPHIRHYVPTL